MNTHINHGYRPHGKNIMWYAASCLKWHNETCNIWTHVCGGLIFSYALKYVCTDTITGLTIDVLAIQIYIIAIMIMYLCSVCYHTFWPISDSVCKTCLCMDYVGILVAVAGTSSPLIVFVLKPSNDIFIMYSLFVICITSYSMYEVLRCAQSSNNRLKSFVLSAWYVPVIWLHAKIYGGHLNIYYSSLAIGIFYPIGVFFYVFQYPEKKWPGHFDMAGNSHNIMHVCILGATVGHLLLFINNLKY